MSDFAKDTNVPTNDCISRQAAIDAIKTWGLIDGLSEGQAIEILADEEKLPSAQTEIIHCKDCKHDNDCEIQYAAQTGNMFFCGYAERREE